MVIVTGANGFIGYHLSNLFEDVIRCDIDSIDSTNKIIHPDDLFQLMKIEKPEIIFHLGAISSTTETNSVAIAKNNILLSCELLEHCVRENITFVYASSASVYGLGKQGFNEYSKLDPLNYYAISKMTLDLVAHQKTIDHPKSKIIGLRYFNVYGPGERHKENMASPVHKFYDQAKNTGEIKIFKGSDKYLRDFIHVDDVIKITKEAANFHPGLYNVGTGRARSFLEVANTISSLTGAKITEIPFPQHLVGKYQEYTCSDNIKINSTGYPQDRISLEEGIIRTINV